MAKCKRCDDRDAYAKGFCARCYYAEYYKRETKDEKKKKRNFIRGDVGILTSNGGKEFIVDLDVFVWAKDILWSYSSGYAKCNRGNGGEFLHKMIRPEFDTVDHINRNPSDNRRCNLRDGGNGINMLNAKSDIVGKSGFRGIYPMRKNWQVRIRSRENRVYLGTYETIDEARAVLRNYAKENGLSEFYDC